MDVLKEALNSVLKEIKQKSTEEQNKLEALVPHFDKETDALAYAKRLMALKPGDVVLLPDVKNKAHKEGVFIGAAVKNGDGEILPQFMTYDHESKRFGIQTTSWMGVTLKD